jgi:hypothetical protein
VLKARKQPVSSVDARELDCWSVFQVSALGVIDLLKSGRSIVQDMDLTICMAALLEIS